MKEFIIVDNVSYSYKTSDDKFTTAIKEVNLTIYKGEFIAIVGLNGSGKSTLAKMFNGLIVPDIGNVFIDGLSTKDSKSIWEIRKKCGFVFQNPDNQIVASIVEEDIAFGPENLGFSSEKISRKVDEALRMVEMEEYREHQTYKLSGGQKQRVAIAGVLAMESECIILDEPTTMLDPKGRKEVLETIIRLNKNEGKTIILVTHNVDEIMHADRVVVMDKGSIALIEKPKNIIKDSLFLKMGFEIPQIMKLAHILNDFGINVNKDIWTADEMERELCLLKSRM